MSHRKRNDYTAQLVLVILALLGLLGTRSPNGFKPMSPGQIRDTFTPPLQDDGPSTDGITTLTVTNSIPHPLVLRLRQNSQGREMRLDPCQGCRVYAAAAEIPSNICKSGTTQTIAVTPGQNQVYWHYKSGNIGDINATWNLSTGRKYSVCLVMDLSRGRTDWDSK